MLKLTNESFESLSKDQLLKQLADLKQIVESPKFYLANYFSDLRNNVDKQIVLNQAKNDANQEKLQKLWEQMIEKIDLFEKQYINNRLVNIVAIKQKLNLINEKIH